MKDWVVDEGFAGQKPARKKKAKRSTVDPAVSRYMTSLVELRNEKYGKKWLRANALKAVAAREAKRATK